MEALDAALRGLTWLWQSLLLPLIETFSLTEHYSECVEAVAMTMTSVLALLQTSGGPVPQPSCEVAGRDGGGTFAAPPPRPLQGEVPPVLRSILVPAEYAASDDAVAQRRLIRSQVGFAAESTLPMLNGSRVRSMPGAPSRGKVLVLDLDETLIFASTSTAGMCVPPSFSEVVPTMSGATLYHVWERPHLQTFLSAVSRLYSVVVFTAASQAYADPLLDRIDRIQLLDGRRRIKKRYFRTECSLIPKTKGDEETEDPREQPPPRVGSGKSVQGVWSKDLSILRVPLDSVVLVDNSSCCLRINPENGLLCPSFRPPRHYGEPQDTYLLSLLVLLEALYFVPDVRAVLRLGTRLR